MSGNENNNQGGQSGAGPGGQNIEQARLWSNPKLQKNPGKQDQAQEDESQLTEEQKAEKLKENEKEAARAEKKRKKKKEEGEQRS